MVVVVATMALTAFFYYSSTLELVLDRGIRTANSSLTLISKMLLDVLEALLYIDLASSYFLGLNILARDLSNESVGS